MGSDEKVRPGCSGDGPGTVVVVVDGVELLLTSVDGRRPDLELVDSLARLQLAARRAGCSIRLRDLADELCDLLELVGLSGVVVATVPAMAERAETPRRWTSAGGRSGPRSTVSGRRGSTGRRRRDGRPRR